MISTGNLNNVTNTATDHQASPVLPYLAQPVAATSNRTPARASVHTEDEKDEDDPRKATFMLILFKENIFRGNITKDISEILKLYKTCADHNKLSENRNSNQFAPGIRQSRKTFLIQ